MTVTQSYRSKWTHISELHAEKMAKAVLLFEFFCFVWSLQTSLMCIIGEVLWLLALVTGDRHSPLNVDDSAL